MEPMVVDHNQREKTFFQRVLAQKPFIVGVVFVLCISLSSFFAYHAGKQQRKSAETICTVETQAQKNKSEPPSLTPKQSSREKEPQWEEFHRLPVVEKKDIDTSTWNEYKNDEVGIRFMYPPEWGKPSGCPAEMHCRGEKAYLEFCSKYPSEKECSEEAKKAPIGHVAYYSSTRADSPGYEYSLSFPDMWEKGDENRTVFFELYGKNKTLGFGREERIEHLYWNEGLLTKDFCDPELMPYDYFLFCYNKKKNTIALRINPFWGEYRLSYLVPLRGKKIEGISFGGEFGMKFLSERYGINYSGDDITHSTNRLIIEKALRERKLPEDIMKNYDLYLKVFETVETY